MVSVLSKVSVVSRLSKKLPDTNCIDIKTKAGKEEGGYQTNISHYFAILCLRTQKSILCPYTLVSSLSRLILQKKSELFITTNGTVHYTPFLKHIPPLKNPSFSFNGFFSIGRGLSWFP